MPCYHPITAWQDDEGKMRFREPRDARRQLELPCGRCIGCRLRRSEEWTTRLMNERQMHHSAAFVTLTYDEKHYTPGLVKEDLQRWLKRLRKRMGPLRYFAAGEYGDQNARPHWHAIIYGPQIAPSQKIREKPFPLWTSKDLDQTWTAGMSTFGEVTPQSCAYVAKYSIKKRTGPNAESHYQRVNPDTGEVFTVAPERAFMSLKPPIGQAWIEKYWKDVYAARDGVPQQNGRLTKPPRRYDEFLKERDSDRWEDIQQTRYETALANKHESTPERLAARETVAAAKDKLGKRNL